MKHKIVDPGNRILRHRRIRKTMTGTSERPRLCVFRSLKHFEAQLIDDTKSQTILSASTREKDFASSSKTKSFGNTASAKQLGAFLAKKAKEKGHTKVVFDRAGYIYHGRVKAFADAARENGLEF